MKRSRLGPGDAAAGRLGGGDSSGGAREAREADAGAPALGRLGAEGASDPARPRAAVSVRGPCARPYARAPGVGAAALACASRR